MAMSCSATSQCREGHPTAVAFPPNRGGHAPAGCQTGLAPFLRSAVDSNGRQETPPPVAVELQLAACFEALGPTV